jgi:class 3 adenylate cyclase/ActR/RegA family two-component response regulator
MNRNYKVLVVEDLPDWIEKLKMILEEENFKVTICRSLEEAMHMMSREVFHFATIDLKLLENVRKYHHLNQSDKWEGWEILRFIKEKNLQSTMGTMVITYYDFKEFEDKATKELGATYFMSKRSFNTKLFLKKLNSYFKEYHSEYYFQGIPQDSRFPAYKTKYYETQKFEAAIRSVQGLRDYFHAKELAGIKTIIFFSDLCESTKYKNERGFVEGLFKSFHHNETVSKIFKEHGGTVVKTIGDCVMGRLDTNKQNQGELATEAINAAINVHEVFADMNMGITKDLEKYRSKTGICIGITGDTYLGDPHGLSVDIAAQLTSLAKPEQIWVCKELIDTANITQLKAQILKIPAFGYKPSDLLGPVQDQKMDGIEDPVPICEIKWHGNEHKIH